MHPNLSREFSPMCHLVISCKPPSPFWHPPSSLHIAEYRMFRGATSEKGCSHSWEAPTTGDVIEASFLGHLKSWPFRLITSGAPGPATAQRLILDSIQVEKMTLRRGGNNTGERWATSAQAVTAWGVSNGHEDTAFCVEGIRDCLTSGYFGLLVFRTSVRVLVSVVSI